MAQEISQFQEQVKKNEINLDLKLEIIANDVPAFNYDTVGGCPVLNTEPQAINLITYPISFDNAYWTKSGATIDDNGGAGYSAPSVDFLQVLLSW